MASALVLSYPTKRNHSSAFDIDDDSLRHHKRPCRVAAGFSSSRTTSQPQFCGLGVDTQAISSNFSLKPNYVPSESKSLDNGSKCSIGDEAIVCRTAKGAVNTNSGDVTPENPSAPTDGSQWVDLFVKEMMSAADVDDARARTTRVLEVLEKSIMARVISSSEATQNLQKDENMVHRDQQMEVLLHENNILKRAVAIQHERQKEHDTIRGELQHLKQLLAKYQEQLRTLEVKNYALAMHLKQSQQSSSMPGHFHPDIF